MGKGASVHVAALILPSSIYGVRGVPLGEAGDGRIGDSRRREKSERQMHGLHGEEKNREDHNSTFQ